jgi:tetratricopeptide (TPR) repeat protein
MVLAFSAGTLPTMSSNATTDEQGQLMQTVEMFEVITQANPHDCQSMEILKDAYWKLGRQTEAIVVTRRLADTYVELGQYSSALLEYEGILQKQPDNPEILAMLGEVEAKLSGGGIAAAKPQDAVPIALDFNAIAAQDPTLITTDATRRSEATRMVKLTPGNDGNEQLAKFLIQHKLAPEDAVNAALTDVMNVNKSLEPPGMAASLIDRITANELISLDALLCGILDRTKFAFVPLDYYEVDRQIVKMLPETLTLGRLIIPFDVISRTMMVATANPFDAQGKEAVQQLIDYNIQWHLAPPAAIFKVLKETYRLEK